MSYISPPKIIREEIHQRNFLKQVCYVISQTLTFTQLKGLTTDQRCRCLSFLDMYYTVHGVVDQAGWFISLTDNLVKTEEKLLTG